MTPARGEGGLDVRRHLRQAQPGTLSAVAIDNWFWRETAVAKAFLMIRDLCRASDDESLQPLGKLSLIPRAVSR